MISIKLCVFDLDGTLINSLEDLADSMNFALSRAALPEHPTDSYKMFVGSGLHNLICRAVSPLPCRHELEDRLRKSFNEYYNDHCFEKTKPYPECMELLEKLEEKGIKTAVLSNKPDEFVCQISSLLFPKHKFSDIRGNRPDNPIKPNPASLLDILNSLGVDKGECLYIGDSDIDIQTAKNAGIKSVGACWGFRGEEELKKAGADILIYSPLELIKNI